MINLPVKKLSQGMVTAQSIYNSKGASYLTKGTSLNDQYISRLKKLGVSHLTVTSINPSFHLLPPDDIVQEKTRVTAIHKVCDTFQEIEETGELNIDPLTETAESILLDVISQRSNLVQLTDIRMHDSYTFAHSVNVAILSAMLGALCGYSNKDLLDLVLGGLLHDIGKIIIPAEILNKPSSLTQSEVDVVRLHPEAGRKKLRELNMLSSSLLAIIAAQHHEHMDGTGYPNHLTDEHIHRYARITAIADVYDALTSNRPYKKAYKPNIAYKLMTRCSNGQFDEQLLALFFDNVALYPVGTILKTELGYAIVKKTEFGRTRSPFICVFADGNAKLLPKPFDIDLAHYPLGTIGHVIEDIELFPLLFHLGVDPAIYLASEEPAAEQPL